MQGPPRAVERNAWGPAQQIMTSLVSEKVGQHWSEVEGMSLMFGSFDDELSFMRSLYTQCACSFLSRFDVDSVFEEGESSGYGRVEASGVLLVLLCFAQA